MKVMTRRSFISSMVAGALAVSCLGITGCGSEPTETQSAADILTGEEVVVDSNQSPVAIEELNLNEYGVYKYQNVDPNSPFQTFTLTHTTLGKEDAFGVRIYTAENPGVFGKIFEWNPSYTSSEYFLSTFCDECSHSAYGNIDFESQMENSIKVKDTKVDTIFRLWGHASNGGSNMRVNNAQYIFNKLPKDVDIDSSTSFTSDEDLYFVCVEFTPSETYDSNESISDDGVWRDEYGRTKEELEAEAKMLSSHIDAPTP